MYSDYKYKYYKYKNKYQELKNKIYQTGGDKPSGNILKNIFLPNQKHDFILNPVWGYLICESSFIQNCFTFKVNSDLLDDQDKIIFRYVKKLYKYDLGQYRPTNSIFENVTPFKLGKFLAIFLIRNLEQFENIFNEDIDRLNMEKKKKLQSLQDQRNKIKTVKSVTIETSKKLKKEIELNNMTLNSAYQLIYDQLKKSNDKNKNEQLDSLDKTKKLLEQNNFTDFISNLENQINCVDSKKSLITKEYDTKLEELNKIHHIFSFNHEDFNTSGFNVLKELNVNFKNKINELIIVAHILLSVLWWIINNKSGALEYFRGIKEVFDNLLKYKDYLLLSDDDIELFKFDIPDDYEKYLFDKTELEKLDSIKIEEIIAKIDLLKNSFKTINYNVTTKTYCPNQDITYPDCGETALRNLVNLIAWNGKNFDINILHKYGPSEQLLNYYTIFNTIDKQLSPIKLNFYDDNLDAKNAWSKIMFNLPEVKYNRVCSSNQTLYYELNSGLNIKGTKLNFLTALSNLLTKINSLKDIDEIKILEDKISREGFGHIIFSKENINFRLDFNPSHYEFINLSKLGNININYPVHVVNNILKLIFDESINFNIINSNSYLYVDWKKAYRYENRDDSALILFISDTRYDKDRYVYNIILNYIVSNDQLTQRIDSLDFRLFDYNTIDLSIFKRMGIEYDNKQIKSIQIKNKNLKIDQFKHTLKKMDLFINDNYSYYLTNVNNLEELHYAANIPINNLFQNLNNLKRLTFGNDFDIELSSSLNNLSKLEVLRFGDSFNNNNKPLSGCLYSLINLKELYFGFEFNQSLYGELNNLKNLLKLVFTDYNRSLDYCLDNLENLEELNLGMNFNKPLGDSLKKLSNLKKLISLYGFNQPFNDSLINLQKLEELQLGSYQYDLIDSIKSLPSLKLLKLPLNYSRKDSIEEYCKTRNIDVKFIRSF